MNGWNQICLIFWAIQGLANRKGGYFRRKELCLARAPFLFGLRTRFTPWKFLEKNIDRFLILFIIW
ncbi:MAG: hypothetical protein AMS15_06950 [Planctomycetes bacterium DG_23]|nr:MAG: hypothetical protein AMS15_06950 [Planctomycetes bacterium DG_23]